MGLYCIKLVAGGESQQLVLEHNVQLFVTEKGATRYVDDVRIQRRFDDPKTEEDESAILGILPIDDKLVGKAVTLRAPVPGGAYKAYVAKLPKGVSDKLPGALSVKNAIALTHEPLSKTQRDAFYLALAKGSYPMLKLLDESNAVQPGLWAEASLVVALLETAEELKNRQAFPSAASNMAYGALTSALDATFKKPAATAYDMPSGGTVPDKRFFHHDFVDPSQPIFNSYMTKEKTPMSGRLAIMMRAWRGTQKKFASTISPVSKASAFLNSYNGAVRAHVFSEAQRIYKEMFAGPKKLSGADAELGSLPEALLAAVGDGTGTAGVVGKENECVGIMCYQAESSNPRLVSADGGEAISAPRLDSVRYTFKRPNSGRQPVIHFFTTGFNGTDVNRVWVRCGKPVETNGTRSFPFTASLAAIKSQTKEDVSGNMYLLSVSGGGKTIANTKLPYNAAEDAKAKPDVVKLDDGRTFVNGFIWDAKRRELEIPQKVFRTSDEFEVEVTSARGDEIFYGLCLVLSYKPVNLQDVYPFGKFIPKKTADMSEETQRLLQNVVDTVSLYDSFSVGMFGGGVGRFRDEKRKEDVVAGGEETDKRTDSERDLLRCSYVDFGASGTKCALRISSYTDPVKVSATSKYYKDNFELSRLRCWAILGLICRELVEAATKGPAGERKKGFQRAVALWESAPENAERATYLSKELVAEGAFDVAAVKAALAKM